MNYTSKLFIIFFLIAAFSFIGFSQTASNDPRRRKPTVELDKLQHFLGKYTTIMDRNSQKLHGTMEINPAVGGWYIERINYTKSEDGKIDSEIRSLITWDPALKHYRIWRFVQLTPQEKHDGVGRFEGDVFIEEYEFEGTNKGQQILRNRITMPNKDEMRIVNEIQSSDGKVTLRGVIIAKRVK
jgi:hypothetical protein